MVGINAQRIVAGVEDILASRNEPSKQDPTEPMGSYHHSIIRSGSDRELTVAFGAGS